MKLFLGSGPEPWKSTTAGCIPLVAGRNRVPENVTSPFRKLTGSSRILAAAITGVETGREQAARRHAAATATQKRFARFWLGMAILVPGFTARAGPTGKRIELIDLMKRRGIATR